MKNMNFKRFRCGSGVLQHCSGQAMVELAIFGAILIFLIGNILRSHMNTAQVQSHQIKAMKLALSKSYEGSMDPTSPNNSHNFANVFFIEDRLSPDLNKFDTIDRTPFVASGSASFSNRLEYPVDFGEVQNNLPIMDLYVNGQHFPLTTASYVFRVIYHPEDACPPDYIDQPLNLATGSLANNATGPEYIRCLRQKAEWSNGHPTFYSQVVNGTADFNSSGKNFTFDLLRNDWDTTGLTYAKNQSMCDDDVIGCAGTSKCSGTASNLCKSIAYQWQFVEGIGSNIDFSSHNYPQMDFLGSTREQTLYAVSQKDHASLMNQLNNGSLADYVINFNMQDQLNHRIHLLSVAQMLLNNDATTAKNIASSLGFTTSPSKDDNIEGVVILDSQMGDIDAGYDIKSSPNLAPGIKQDMGIYSWVRPNTYLQIKEGKLYNPETHKVVRSISSKDHVDLISRMFQLSNNTQRFCIIHKDGRYSVPATLKDQNNEPNPVQACSDDCMGDNFTKTCYSPSTRILYIRTLLGEKTTRKWFTDVTQKFEDIAK